MALAQRLHLTVVQAVVDWLSVVGGLRQSHLQQLAAAAAAAAVGSGKQWWWQ